MRVVGIDPGFDRVGWAAIEINAGKTMLLGAGCIETDRLQGDRFVRYEKIDGEMEEILRRAQPNRIGIEQLFAAKNVSSVIPVAEARGIVLACFLRYRQQCPAEIFELNPSTVKLHITGNGRADKAAVRKMVLLQLTALTPAQRAALEKQVDDTIDAVAIALTAASLQISV